MARFTGHSANEIERLRKGGRKGGLPQGMFRGTNFVSGAQLAAEQAMEHEANLQKLKNKGYTDVSQIKADSDAALQANKLKYYGQQAGLDRGFKRSMQDDEQKFKAGENALNRDADTDKAFWDRDFKRKMQREQNQFLANQGERAREFEMNKPVYKEFTDQFGTTTGYQNVNTSEARLKSIPGGMFDDSDMERLMGPSPAQNTKAVLPQNTAEPPQRAAQPVQGMQAVQPVQNNPLPPQGMQAAAMQRAPVKNRMQAFRGQLDRAQDDTAFKDWFSSNRDYSRRAMLDKMKQKQYPNWSN